MPDLPEVPPGANMEDCSRCTDPNPDYPWICPGHPAETTEDVHDTGRENEVTDIDTDSDTFDKYARLRVIIADGIRNSTYSCVDDNCPLTEEECYEQHPILEASTQRGVIHSVSASVDALAENVIQTLFTNRKHVYFSTSCLHDDHAYCQATTGSMGLKQPTECKFCNLKCVCACHVCPIHPVPGEATQ